LSKEPYGYVKRALQKRIKELYKRGSLKRATPGSFERSALLALAIS